ncbi:NUDIX hydrolase [Phenylobacterium sp. LjRoot225]|uniref:NUDIX hydrolase n=1 Tax=Phenylobacterium sp. LjRoot225 TaxID=3342285 RepID=UPI003ECD32EC
MAKKGPVPSQSDRAPRSQAAALPWRCTDGGEVKVLLITSRQTRRWVIPKGWPIKGLKMPETAAREAFEEAGVEGEVSKKKLGIFHYEKRLGSGQVLLRVAVFALKVEAELEVWPEAEQREKLWTTCTAAAELVQETELAALLRAFSPVPS